MIKAILAGGRKQDQALVALYRKGAEWRRYFVYKGLSTEIAEEVVQETICKIFEKATKYTGGSGFGDASANAWMWQIAKNCMVDEVRRKKLTGTSLDSDDEDEATAAKRTQVEAEISSGVTKSHTRDAELCVSAGIEDFAADFPDRARALEMQMDGEDVQSIANRIGRTIGATKEFLSQCKKKLAPYIEHCLPLLAV